MAGSLNKVQIIGNLGRDPEVREFPSGGSVCNLTIATSETWTDKQSGERRERTEWHRVAIFNPHLVRLASNYLRKGSKVYLEGKLETRKWTDGQGVERYSTEIVLRPYAGEMTFLDKREGGSSGSDYTQQSATPAGQRTASQRQGYGQGRPAGGSPAPAGRNQAPSDPRSYDYGNYPGGMSGYSTQFPDDEIPF